MQRITRIVTALMWGSLLIPLHGAFALNPSDRANEILEDRLTSSAGSPRVLCRNESLCGPRVLLRFYTQRAFRPAWSADDGPLPQAAILVKEIRAADLEGLRPEDYHLASIETLLAEILTHTGTNPPFEPEILADLDLLLTDAFLLYGSHLLTGHVNPETIQSEWVIEKRVADLAEILEAALNANDIEKALKSLRPPHPDYAALRNALLTYENIVSMGGWPEVPPGPKLEKGDQGPRVGALRSHLMVSGDLVLSEENSYHLFDEVLEAAVRRYQDRHGLKGDGIVGRETRKALNVSAQKRVRQLKANLERWRWLPQNLGERYILVNIANFELDVVENGHIMMTMRVVVGRRYRRTPVFSGTITYMELNPYWHIPPNIAKRDILPHAQGDPQYLVRKNIRIFQSWDDDAPEIRSESVDWSEITPGNLSLKFRQEPGPVNALGQVKFMFPNKFNVYLHDTPAQELFKKTKRTFSSGCIRIERPIDLAAYLLQSDPEWTREKIREAIDSGETQIVRLPESIPVHLLYWTAWVDSDGTVHFHDDIYGRDKRLDKALNKRPPSP